MNTYNESTKVGISIIIPIYNRVDYCNMLLKSFENLQKPSIPFELILSDNSEDSQISNQS